MGTKGRRNRITKYDRVELALPLGTNDRLKEVSSTIGISVNDYIARLIKTDLEKDHKKEDMVSMLNRW